MSKEHTVLYILINNIWHSCPGLEIVSEAMRNGYHINNFGFIAGEKHMKKLWNTELKEKELFFKKGSNSETPCLKLGN